MLIIYYNIPRVCNLLVWLALVVLFFFCVAVVGLLCFVLTVSFWTIFIWVLARVWHKKMVHTTTSLASSTKATTTNTTTTTTTTGTKLISWNTIQEHSARDNCWLVIDNKVYDISTWHAKHPGGKVIRHYAGQDATDPFRAFHRDISFAEKFMRPLFIGEVDPTTRPAEPPIIKDFRKLRDEFEREGLFKPNMWFFWGMLAHILLLEVISYASMCYFGTGWATWLLCAVLLMTAQAQAGWLQVPPNPQSRIIINSSCSRTRIPFGHGYLSTPNPQGGELGVGDQGV